MVVAEKEMRVAIFQLPHVAELVMSKVKAELLTKPKEIAFLNAKTPNQVVIAPLTSRKT